MQSFDIMQLNPNEVVEEIKKEIETRGTLDFTSKANNAVQHSELLKSIKAALGKDQEVFAWVMRSSYDESLAEVRVNGNTELLLATIAPQMSERIRTLATRIRRDENTKSTEFQAFKRAIISELNKALLMETKGANNFTEADFSATDFKFVAHWTSEARKNQIEESRNRNEDSTQALRTRFRSLKAR
jgi:hypothetical protein